MSHYISVGIIPDETSDITTRVHGSKGGRIGAVQLDGATIQSGSPAALYRVAYAVLSAADELDLRIQADEPEVVAVDA